MIRYFLRLEGLVLLVVASMLYFVNGWSVWHFLLLFLLPDISLLAYLKNSKIGDFTYNLGHTFTTPFVVMSLTALLNEPFGYKFGLIWLAHIGFDRFLGFGLRPSSHLKS